jgi:hypothetical protein
MFVRWKRRKLAQKESACSQAYSLYAVLVRNQRVEGKTMQQVVKYLAYISESDIEDPAERLRFWERVDKGLIDLHLPPDQVEAIDQKLNRVVPRT